ncbi:HD domain-containing protein [Dysosmobacter sp. Marseille-Q4140]|nr:HD domain-containing protein [Dysosmobacter sp. Marseille-Q4140]
MVKIPEHAAQVLSALEGAGFGAWCVGGCVRDSLLGRTPQDWDVTTAAVPERVLAIFGDRAVPTGLAHGTVTVRTAGGVVEVTTLRRDGTYRDHRRPQSVTFTGSLEEDLCRRDFTVNAMALDLRGELADPLGGRADLDAGLLRCVGEPDRRFREDALRILRGVRFAAALGFAVEQETDRSLRANRALLALIAPERIWAELKGLLTAPGAAEALRAYPEVIGVFWPEVLDMVGFPQRNRHHCYDVWEHTLHALAQVPPELELRLTMLLHDIGKPGCCTIDASGCGHFKGHPARSAALAEEMLRRLRTDNATRETVVRLVAWHDRNIPRTRPGVASALRQLGETDLRRLLRIKRADNLAQDPAYRAMQEQVGRAEAILDHLLAEGACVSLDQLAVRGGDLLALGLSGPAVGETLEALLDAVIEERLPNDRAAQLEYARRRCGKVPGGEKL